MIVDCLQSYSLVKDTLKSIQVQQCVQILGRVPYVTRKVTFKSD